MKRMDLLPIGSELTDGSTENILVLILSSAFDRYMKTVNAIVLAPHYKISAVHKTELSRKNESFKCILHKSETKNSFDTRKKIIYDTIENRFAKFILISTLKSLIKFKQMYSSENADEEILDRVDCMILAIKRNIETTFFKCVSEHAIAQSSPMVFCMECRYRELYKNYSRLKYILSANVDALKTLVSAKNSIDNANEIMSNDDDITDWSENDVLVGSFGSNEQFYININKCFYYVPARVFDIKQMSAKYIALYQSLNMFEDEAGIRYYGEILSISVARRKNIPVKMTKDNGEEIYYVFRIRKWETLDKTIAVKDEGVREPRYTNMFLLKHCTQSYELFNIHSQEQYCLLCELKSIYRDFSSGKENPNSDFVRKFGDCKAIWIHDGYFDILDEKGRLIFMPPLKVSDFIRRPNGFFRMVAAKINK